MLVCLAIITPVIISFSLVYWFLSEKSQEIHLRATITTQNGEQRLPVKDVEVRWIGENISVFRYTDEEGNVDLPITLGENSKGRLSLYHHDYRPTVEPFDLDTLGQGQIARNLGEIVISQLFNANEVDEEVLNQIAVTTKELEIYQKQLQFRIAEIKKIHDPTRQQALLQVEYRGKLRLIQHEIEFLRDDSLLYVYREIDRQQMMIAIERTRSILKEHRP